MDRDYLNNLINECIDFSNQLSKAYNYPDNVTHLLYIIIPAFIIKYGKKDIIKSCFSKTFITITSKSDEIKPASYISIPYYENNEVHTKKVVVLNNYSNSDLIDLLDSIVHEFNHAINSFINEITIDEFVALRTGIVYNYFDKDTLKCIKRDESIILEEVINTKQTEDIINVIKSFSNYEIESSVVNSTLYSISHSFDKYKSDAYLLEGLVCKKLLENKTFISTFEKLRFDGYVDDIYHFFDSIVGSDGSLVELSILLTKSLELVKDYSNSKFFKKKKLNKINSITSRALKIVETFNNNTVYK